MKTLLRSLPCALPVLFVGCLQTPTPAVMEHMISPPTASQPATAHGSLVVFSAFEAGPPSATEIDPDTRHRTDYEIRNQSGELVQRVRNRAGAFGEEPAKIDLPASHYQVTVRTNGHGAITLPIVVGDHQVTTLHLEGPIKPTGPFAPAEYDAVRIPNGPVVGWSSTSAMARSP